MVPVLRLLKIRKICKSMTCSSKWVAKECRSVRTVEHGFTPALVTALGINNRGYFNSTKHSPSYQSKLTKTWIFFNSFEQSICSNLLALRFLRCAIFIDTYYYAIILFYILIISVQKSFYDAIQRFVRLFCCCVVIRRIAKRVVGIVYMDCQIGPRGYALR